jgi:hypothetical protein
MSKSNKKLSKSKTVKKTNQQYCKEWYEKNKERHHAYINTKILCDCGSEIARCGLARHFKSIKHLEWERKEKEMKDCRCGGRYHPDFKNDHMKCKQHQNYLKSLK